jgi:quinol monooxygenase YgiN
MILALIDFEVAQDARDAALECLQPLLREARSFEGNRSYRVFTSSDSLTHVGMAHEWDTLEHFNAYTASTLFSRIGQVMRPIMTTPPVSRRMRTEVIEEVHG